MTALSAEVMAEVRKGAAAARDLETWLADEERDLDGELSQAATAEEATRRAAIAEIANSVIGLAPQMSAYDIALEVSTLAAEGCQNALGHMLFASAISADILA